MAISETRMGIIRRKQNGTEKFSVRVEEDLSVKLEGVPGAFTDESALSMMDAQMSPITWSGKGDLDSGKKGKLSFKWDAEASKELFLGEDAPAPKKRGKKEPVENGQTV